MLPVFLFPITFHNPDPQLNDEYTLHIKFLLQILFAIVAQA